MRRELPALVRTLSIALSLALALPAAALPRGVKRVHSGAAGSGPRNTSGPTNPQCTDSNHKPVPCSVHYFGGAVLSNAKVYAVLWGNSVAQQTKDNAGGFLTAVTNNDWIDWLAEYNTEIAVQVGPHAGQAGSQQVIGRGTFAGSFTIAPALGAATSIADSDIITELNRQLDGKVLPPPDANTLYAIFFPPGMQIDDGTGAISCQDWCGYHSTWTRGGKSSFYAVLPDHNDRGCNNGCGSDTNFNNLCATAAHELAESITDAEVGLAQNNDEPLAWYDVNGGEVGDMCNAQDLVVSIADGKSYGVQQIYSQKTGKCETTRFEAQDFKLLMNPNVRSLAAGTSATIPVTTATTAGAPQTLALTVSGLPAGVTAQLDKASLTSGTTAQLTLTAAASAPASSDSVVAVVARVPPPGTLAHSASLLLEVTTGAPLGNDFTLVVAPGTGVATAGGHTASYTVTTGALRSPETVALSVVSGLPAGVTASFAPASVLAGETSTLTLTAPAGTARAAAATFTVKGVSASVAAGHTATAQVSVQQAPTVTLSAPAAGATLSGTADVTASATVDAAATLSNLELLDGATVIGSATASPFTLHWNTLSVADGSHALAARVTDSQGNAVTTSELSVNVANGGAGSFLLRLDPLAVTVAAGGQNTVGVITTAVGASVQVSLAVSGLPAGVTGSFNPASFASGGSSTLTLSAGAAAVSGISSFTVTGSAGAVTRTGSAQLTVAPASAGPSVTLTAPQSGVTVNGSVQLQATATPGQGSTLTRIDLLADGAVIGSGSTSPASATWQTAGVAAGSHSLTAKVTDSAGRSAVSSAVTVTVAAPAGSSGGCAGSGSPGLLALAGLWALARRRRARRSVC